ncbi:hypothetical protein MTO96_035177 [Rhipicephalus appendiculatus]
MIIATIQEHRRERPKVDNFVADVVASYDDEEFRRHFRLGRSTCEMLTRQFTASPQYPKNDSHGGTPQKSAEEHISAFFWYAGNKATFRSVAQLFGMAESMVHGVVDRVEDCLEAVAPSYLKMPRTEEEKQQTSACFKADMDDESGTDGSSHEDAQDTKESTATARLLRQLEEAKRRRLARSFN